MKEERLLNALGQVDDKYIEEASERPAHRSLGWVKWTAAAAGLVVLAVGAYMMLSKHYGYEQIPADAWPEDRPSPDASGEPFPAAEPPKDGNIAGQSDLAAYMDELGLPAERIAAPVFAAGGEMPQITGEQLLGWIKNNTTVQGIVRDIDVVRVKDGETVWYIATFTVSVSETITGEAGDEARGICAAAYTGTDAIDGEVPIPAIAGCTDGTEAVFVLCKVDGEVWNVAGENIFPSELGDYFVICMLERSGDELVYKEQGISVSADDL